MAVGFAEYIVIGVAALILLGVLASKISDRIGVPALLLFLVLGMLAGSEGIGGIEFSDPGLMQIISVVALALILFSGGLDTDWSIVREVAPESWTLATVGVFLTALVLAVIASYVFNISFLEGMLMASIMSSTDAAAVFAILRSRNVSLKHPLKPLLELESGSNDPMAVLLTVGCIELLLEPSASVWVMVLSLVRQMVLGAIVGYLMGRVVVWLINHLDLGYDGLYPVLSTALVLITYSITAFLGGSGYLAVYLAGIVIASRRFVHRRSLLSFHDGLAWLSQIVLFVSLGLLVFPSQLVPIAGRAMVVALALIVVARPVVVYVLLAPSRLNLKEKTLIAWVGLRGAVPVVLGIFPLVAGVPNAALYFNVVFFVVIVSALLQGATIPIVARWLGVDAPFKPRRELPLEYVPVKGLKSELHELVVPAGTPAVGSPVVSLELPPGFQIVLVGRGDEYIVSNGRTVIREGDRLLVLAEEDMLRDVQPRLGWTEA
ncbi:MAG TPA: potassium/proton antiporter [Chloroflexi bacterium]|nr:potassium/proton antiporter [Chloroflexota bacterium]